MHSVTSLVPSLEERINRGWQCVRAARCAWSTAAAAVAWIELCHDPVARASLLAIALLVASACKSPEQKLQKSISQTVSSNGTLQLTAEAWLDNRVPRAFARLAVKTTRDDLATQSSKVAKSNLPEAGALQREMAILRTAASDLQRGIERGDRASVIRAHTRLVRNAAALREMIDRETAGTQ